MSLSLSRSSRSPRAVRASISSSLSWSSLRSLAFLRRASIASGILLFHELVELADALRDQLALVLFLVVVGLDDLRGVDHLGGELVGHGWRPAWSLRGPCRGRRRSRRASCRRRPASGSPCAARAGIPGAASGRGTAALPPRLSSVTLPSLTSFSNLARRSCAFLIRLGVVRQDEVGVRAAQDDGDLFLFLVGLAVLAGEFGNLLVEVFGQLIDGDKAVRLLAVGVGGALEAVEQGLGEDAVVRGRPATATRGGWRGRRRGRACGSRPLRSRGRRGTPRTASR